MSSCQVNPSQNNYTLVERGWFSDTVRQVTKQEFILHHRAKTSSAFSISSIVKTLAVGILVATQILRPTTLSRNWKQIVIPALACHLLSQINTAHAQTTTTYPPVPTPAPGPQGNEFQVNTYTIGAQRSPSVATLIGGGFVVTWESDGQDGDRYGIFGQRYDASGSRDGSELQVNTFTTSLQRFPSVAALAEGGFVVTWSSGDQDGSGAGIYGQRYDVAGAQLGSEFRVNTYTTDHQSNPSVAALSGGGFVVTWHSDLQDGSYYGIYGQKFDVAGAKVGSEFQANSYIRNDQNYPSLAALPGGGFVVTWQSLGQDGSAGGIYGQKYDPTGAKVGSEFQINSYTINYQVSPSVAALSGSGFVVTWQSLGQDTSNYGIYGQRYDAAGAKIGSEFQINTYTTDDQASACVVALSGGGFAVTWVSYLQDGSGLGIYGQRYDAAGAKIGSEFQVNNYTNIDQASPSAAALPGGGFVVTWSSGGQDGSSDGIYGRIFPGNSTSTTSLATTLSSSPNLTASTLLTRTAINTSTLTKAAILGMTGSLPSSFSELPMNSTSDPNAITGRAPSSLGNFTPVIAGIACGIGALTCSVVAAVVLFLRRRARDIANNAEQGIKLPRLASNQQQLHGKSSTNQYVQIAIQSGQPANVNKVGNEYMLMPEERGREQRGFYNLPGSHPKASHYSDPNERVRELERNPPQPNYVGINDLEIPNDSSKEFPGTFSDALSNRMGTQ